MILFKDCYITRNANDLQMCGAKKALTDKTAHAQECKG